MAAESDWLGEAAFPALLRAARNAYGSAVHVALVDAGFDDVPRDGSYVLAAVARTGAPLSRIIEQLGVSKQAAGHLIDTLVTRGYLDRTVSTEDRRRLTISLAERGHAAVEVISSAVDRVDAQLIEHVGAKFVAHTRATLASLIETHRADKRASPKQ